MRRVEMGDGKPSRSAKFVPGSILRMQLDAANPLASGLPSVIFLRQKPRVPARARGRAAKSAGRLVRHRRPVAERLGMGQQYLNGAHRNRQPRSKGSLLLYGREIAAGRSHGTFKLLFSRIHHAPEAGR